MKSVSWLCGVAVGVPILMAIAAAPESNGPLLEPTGNYPVGRVSMEIADPSRPMPDGRYPRRLMLHIWYPASSCRPTTLPYIEGLKDARSLFTDDEFSLLASVRTHASAEPPVSPPSSRFPVQLFSHGDQMAAFLYSNLNEELASNGYVVVAVDTPGAALFVSYPDGTMVRYSDTGRPSAEAPQYRPALSEYLRHRIAEQTADLRFVQGRLRTLKVRGQMLRDFVSERVGAFGHSAGGLAAALLSQQQMRLDACLNMDGRCDAAPFLIGVDIAAPASPFMYLAKPFRSLTDSELQAEGLTRPQANHLQEEIAARDRRLLATAGPPAYRALLHHAEHGSFSDEPLLRNRSDAKSLSLMRNIREVIVEFFDTSLQDGGRRLLRPQSSDSLELEVMATPRPFAEPDGPANGRQPIHPETHSTSPAAGSRR